MLSRVLLLMSLVAPVTAKAQAVQPRPARAPAQQRLSLWTSHALQNSIQGSQLRINAQVGGLLSPQLLAQSRMLYANGQDMLGAAPADPQYRDWVAAARRYDQVLWGIVGKPTLPAQGTTVEDVQAVTLINACTSRAIYQFQAKRLGGRLREAPDVDPLTAVQAMSLPTSPGSADVKQLARVSATIIQLSQVLPPAEPPNGQELRYRKALEEILGIAGGALREPAPTPAPDPVPTPVVKPVDPNVSTTEKPAGNNDLLPGNGELPTPR